ncbi:tRNA (cytidine(56)-2'-O)-methyltransferase [Methanocella sp. CWC-04]|uniref:tRNA (cytidine(56)-2'-O)-methyltransferase n=1 Tax=Methanooceanicella nereidis TaxID=2052831 RepID=A0AAP2W6R6_9EURY|nr:tRNA (cytidine(56)-2'-O)-methyltransferase [Methanocella sp. CWC-04]MCD1295618.1 tRNA (cytidine(56)-2'-O)-methyltransferase [Methanocella sp. CWC-04]
MSDIVVLRLGHRPERDSRVTTHVGLTSRVLGATGMLLTSDDKSVRESIDRVVKAWGGDFWVKTGISYRSEIKKWKESGGIVVHLTMYGINMPDCIDEIRERFRTESVMIVVGAEKVPGDVYELSDYNVAIGNQPHSEIAALALFLDRLQEGRTLTGDFIGGELKIVPSEHGKTVLKK